MHPSSQHGTLALSAVSRGGKEAGPPGFTRPHYPPSAPEPRSPPSATGGAEGRNPLPQGTPPRVPAAAYANGQSPIHPSSQVGAVTVGPGFPSDGAVLSFEGVYGLAVPSLGGRLRCAVGLW